jgi:hypothetical protein
MPIAMTVQLVIFRITITTMAVIKIKAIAPTIKQVSKAIATIIAIVMQVEEVVDSIALVALQVAPVL